MSGGSTSTESGEGQATSSILADLRASGDSSPEAADLGTMAAVPRPRVSVQNIIIVIVLVVSAASLYLMRKQGMNSGMHFDRVVKIDADLDKVKPVAHTAAQIKLLEELAHLQDRHISVTEKIQKNPFRLDAGTTPDGTPIPAPILDNTPAITAALAGLTLNGIMQGPVPLARINGATVRVGDIIDQWFVVSHIHDRAVDLVAEGKTYTLSMGETANPGGRRPRNTPYPPRP